MTTKKSTVLASFVNDNVYTKAFTPREHQVELLDLARERDLIVCLANRGTQNFLCLQLVHSFACHCDKPGICMCLMDDADCAAQFVKDVQDFTALSVHHTKEENNFSSEHQVIVTSCSQLLEWFNTKCISASAIKLLILDQCHKVLQPESDAAKVIRHVRSSSSPSRILGLTGSLLEGGIKSAAHLELQLCKLEQNLGCKAETASDVLSILRYYPRPNEALLEARSPQLVCPLYLEIITEINNAKDFLLDHQHDLKTDYSDFLDENEVIPEPKALPMAILTDLQNVLTSMGPWCADRAALVLLLRVEQLKVKTKYERHYLLFCMISTLLIKIRAICDHEFQQYEELERIQKFSSHKVLRLLEIIAQFHDPSETDGNCDLLIKNQSCATLGNSKQNSVSNQVESIFSTECEENGVGQQNESSFASCKDIIISGDLDPQTCLENESCNKQMSSIMDVSSEKNSFCQGKIDSESPVNELINSETLKQTSPSSNQYIPSLKTTAQTTEMYSQIPNDSILKTVSNTNTCDMLCASVDAPLSEDNCKTKLITQKTILAILPDERNHIILNHASDIEEMKFSDNKMFISESDCFSNLTDNKVESISSVRNCNTLETKINNGVNVTEKNVVDPESKVKNNEPSGYRRPLTRTERRFHQRGSPRKFRRPVPTPFTQQGNESEPLCGMVFVARRFTAQVLYHLLNAVRHIMPELANITPQYTASLGEDGEVRDLEKEHRKQEEVLKRFRLRECNLLVCTPMLEEGVELPRCNLVIRFDPPSSFKAKVQSRGRARVNNAHYVTLVDEKNTKDFVQSWAESLCMEKLLLSRCHNREPSDEEEKIADSLCLSVPPYYPSGNTDGAAVALCGAVTLVNRYCAKLPSDTFTRLTPLWHYEEVDDLVRCCVRLPINSPLKQEVIGPFTKLHVMARRLAALEMCKALFEIGELDEELQPVGKESFLAQEQANLGLHEEEENTGNEEEDEQLEFNLEHRPGTTKRRQYYYKKVADALMECRPEAGQEAYLYRIKLHLSCPLPEEQNTRGRKIYPPEESPRGFGILTLKPIPQICPFPIFTRSGEVSVSLELSPNKVVLSSEQCEKVVAFLNYTFSSVLRLQKHLMIFGPESAENSYYIVPITNKHETAVDWDFVDLIWDQKDAIPNPVPEEERNNFTFDYNKYQDAVVMPWYRNQDQPQYFYVAEICTHLSPKSQFPGGEYNTFEEYYNAKYGLKVQCLTQPLLDVDHTSARLNFLTPRYVNRKGVALPVSSEHTKRNKRENLEQKQILVAELCALHPFPASLWRQAVSLPCILYRINGLLLADELRCKVAHDIGLGMHILSSDFRWPPLDFGWSLAEVLQKSREALSNNQTAITGGQETKKKNKIIEICEEEQKEDSKEEGTGNDESKPWLDIGTWSNDMAIQGDDCDSLTDEMPEDLPFNITMLSGNNIGDGPSGSDWGTGIQSHTRVRYGSPTFIPTRKQGSVMDGGMSDTYSSFSDDDYDDDYSSDMSDDPEMIVDNNLQAVHPDGLRIEFKSDHVAEAFDDQPTFVLPDDVIVEPKDIFVWNWEDFGPEWETIKENYEKQVIKNCDVIENSELLIHREEHFKIGKLLLEQDSVIRIHRHPVKNDKPDVTSNANSCIDESAFIVNAITKDSINIKSVANITPKLNTCELNEVGEYAKMKDEIKYEHIKTCRNETELDLKKYEDMNIENPEESPSKCASTTTSLQQESHRSANIQDGDARATIYVNNILSSDTKNSGLSFSFDEQPYLESHPGPSPSIILQALTMSNANDGINLERLETIGDSFLKYAITTYLYCTHENIHEGKLSHLRSKQVSNLQLYRLGRDKQLGRSMIATKFEPHDNWLPPCYFVPWKLEKALIKAGVPPGLWNRQELASLRLMDNDTIDKLVWERKNELRAVPPDAQENSEHLLPFVPYNLLTQHSIPDKSLADCVEALIGAYLIACGPRGALLFMSWLGIKVLPSETDQVKGSQYGWLAPPPSPLLRNVLDPEGELNRMLNGFEQFEERLKYRFRDRAYLLQAMSHASFSPNRLTDCYQRLEFLGDAVLAKCDHIVRCSGYMLADYLITRYLYEDERQHSPGALTDLRSALVNNAIFAVLAVRHGFHQFFLHLSPGLAQVIQRFVRLQQANNNCLSPQYYVLGDGDCSEAEDIEVPKALGDVFESVAGAIFLDSDMSLDAVWHTYHAMMAPELELFSAHVPKSPIRELLEREPETAKFGKPEKLADGRRVRVSVEVFGQGVFRGIGRNYRIAKSTAAKCALRHLCMRRNINNDVHRFY